MMKHVVQRMIEHKVGGTIVNISSVTAKMGNMGQCRVIEKLDGLQKLINLFNFR